VDRYVVAPPILTNAAAFTFEWWMQVRSFTHPNYMATFSQAPPTYISSSSGFNFFVGNGGAAFGLAGHWTDGTFFDLRTGIPFGPGVWKHVAVTYDGRQLGYRDQRAFVEWRPKGSLAPGNHTCAAFLPPQQAGAVTRRNNTLRKCHYSTLRNKERHEQSSFAC